MVSLYNRGLIHISNCCGSLGAALVFFHVLSRLAEARRDSSCSLLHCCCRLFVAIEPLLDSFSGRYCTFTAPSKKNSRVSHRHSPRLSRQFCKPSQQHCKHDLHCANLPVPGCKVFLYGDESANSIRIRQTCAGWKLRSVCNSRLRLITKAAVVSNIFFGEVN